MATATNPLISSSSFFGNPIFLSPPTPKTTKPNCQIILNRTTPEFRSFPSKATLTTLLVLSLSPVALAADVNPRSSPILPPPAEYPAVKAAKPSFGSPFSQNLLLTALKPQSGSTSDLPEGGQWRYNEFLNAVKKGKVERVRFSKDGSESWKKNALERIIAGPEKKNAVVSEEKKEIRP